MTDGRRTAAYGVLAAAVMAAIIVSLWRGVWLDEGYTLWFTGRDLGFAQALEQRWMRDAHPPLYYAWCWLLRPLFGNEIGTLRLVNLGVLLIPALTWLSARSVSIRDDRFHRIFAILVASSPFFILYAAELRSYFAMYVLAATLVAQAKLLVDTDGAPSTPLTVVTVATALLLFNVHYLGCLVAGVVLALLALDGILRRDWRRVLWTVVTGVAGVAIVGFTAIHYLTHATPGTGHDIGMAGGAAAIVGVLGLTIGSAPVAVIVALRGASPAEAAMHDRFTVGSVIAAALLIAGFLAYNVAQHNLLARYVIGAAPVVLALIAVLAVRGCAYWRSGEAAIAAAALVAVLATSAYGLWNRRWETNTPAIATIVASCPETHVFAISAIPFMQAASPVLGIPGVYDAFRLTYRSAAQQRGFPVEVIDRIGTSRLMSTECPTILWVEHRFFAPMFNDRTLIAATGLTSPTGRIVVIRRIEGKGRLVLVLKPS